MVLSGDAHAAFGCDLKRSCIVRLQGIEDATDRRTGVSTAATFGVDAGRPGAHRI